MCLIIDLQDVFIYSIIKKKKNKHRCQIGASVQLAPGPRCSLLDTNDPRQHWFQTRWFRDQSVIRAENNAANQR